MSNQAQMKRHEAPPLQRLQGTSSNAKDITNRLQYAAHHYHLVSPQTAVGQLPPGLGVALSAVVVDAEHETYKIPGGKNLGLSKTALDKIAAGAGVSWDPQRSGRLDDGRDPYYCRYRVVGTVRNFDGSHTVIQGEKEVDLRDGSPQCEGLHAIARKNNRRNADDQIREMRLHILSHAETKARLRAVRSLGIRTSYEKDELQKPFVAARVMFTGQTDDPELRRHIADRVADSFLGSSSQLYGDPAPALQQPQQPRTGTAPPPVGSVPAEQDDFAPELGAGSDGGSAYIDAPSEPQQQRQPAAQQSAPAKPAGDVDPSQFKVPGGRDKGKPLTEAGDGTLDFWRNRIATNLDEGSCKYPEQDTKLLAALETEIDRREKGAQQGEAAAPAQQGGDEPPPPDAPEDLFDDGGY